MALGIETFKNFLSRKKRSFLGFLYCTLYACDVLNMAVPAPTPCIHACSFWVFFTFIQQYMYRVRQQKPDTQNINKKETFKKQV